MLLGVVAPDLPELLEDRLLVLGRDTDAGVTHRDLGRAVRDGRADADVAAFRCEFNRVREKVEEDLLDFPLVATEGAESLVHCHRERDPAARGPLAHQGDGVVDRLPQMEVGQLQLHPARLDLREVEDVVDQGEQVAARGEDILQILLLLAVDVAEHPLQEHLGKADDGVERCPQLVRHVGEELRLVAIRDLELAALLLELLKQARVLQGQRRLGREGLEQLDHLDRELAGRLPSQREAPDDLVLA